jgi:uncharacterized protein (DUF2132 family)
MGTYGKNNIYERITIQLWCFSSHPGVIDGAKNLPYLRGLAWIRFE